jgi:AraC family transcriptional regulator, transcriptional activator of pobA
MKPCFPTYEMCQLLVKETSARKQVVCYSLRHFLSNHQNVVFPHRHDFYQLLYVTHGKGKHIIDFEEYEVKAGCFYNVAPGQVHEWIFDEDIDGILINFNEDFFDAFVANPHVLRNLLFFEIQDELFLGENGLILSLFEKILSEYNETPYDQNPLLAVYLLELLFQLQRQQQQKWNNQPNKQLPSVLRSFQELIELHFSDWRLPKQYAEQLAVTPNRLNVLCMEYWGKSAGELIRQRVILESKRLLVQSNLSVAEIAWNLKFEDNSYFVRFFKKSEQITPMKFRLENKRA